MRYNAAVRKLLIVGGGDIARRAIPWLIRRFRIYVLSRRPEKWELWRQFGVYAIPGDLDDPGSLFRLSGLAKYVLHLAPPDQSGGDGHFRDARTRHLLAALGRGQSLPHRLVYVSTTGVYGDCAGAWVDEAKTPCPITARAKRRLDAEESLRDWGAKCGVPVLVLRTPGIYALSRLPQTRLMAGLPALTADEDVYSGHIHADDLAKACCLSLFRGKPGRCYNVADDSHLRMGDYFDLVADHLGLPRPPRYPKEKLASCLSAAQLSFLNESRRIKNERMRRELRLKLIYPTVMEALSAKPAIFQESGTRRLIQEIL